MSKKCFYCERPFANISVGELSGGYNVIRTKDHIIPKSKGGINNHINMVSACDKCNKLKSDKLPEEFLIFLNASLNKKCYHGFKKQDYLLIIHNTGRLIDKIKDYRSELSTKKEPPIPQLIKKAVEVIKASPASKVQERSQQAFIKKFSSTYPYIFEMLIETNPDLPRWLYDNVLKLAN